MPGKPPCYVNGTRIRTAHGETLVDDIRSGDQVVVNRHGEERLEVVRWVGFSAIDLRKHANLEEAAPIRFRKDAIAEGRPRRDLLLSPDHCLIIDGLCVPAKLLVNGGTVIRDRDHAAFMYYHIELDRHGILIAENAFAESYLDTGNRSLFENGGEPRQLHPSFAVEPDVDQWLTDGCAPLVRVSDQLEPIWRRLAERSQQIGFAVRPSRTVRDPDVHLVADGERIVPVSDRDCCYVFAVPAGVRSVSLASRACIPADRMGANLRDQRRLGVSVGWIAIRSERGETLLMPHHAGLTHGWNDFERSGTAIWRWTEGVATIPWEGVAGAATVTIRCTAVDQYPAHGQLVALVA
jgi:antigen 43